MTYSKRKLSELLIEEVIQKSNMELFEEVIHDDYEPRSQHSTSSKWVQAGSFHVGEMRQFRTHKDRFRKFIEIQANTRASGVGWIWTITNYLETKDESAVFYTVEFQVQDSTKLQDDVLISEGGYEVRDYKRKFVVDGTHLIKFKDNKIVGLHFIWDTLSEYHGYGLVTLNKDPDTVFSQYWENIQKSGILS